MAQKTISINKALWNRKTVKTASILDSIPTATPAAPAAPATPAAPAAPLYGCLKRGKNPTLKELKKTNPAFKDVKNSLKKNSYVKVLSVAKCGKTLKHGVNVILNDSKMVKRLETDRNKWKRHTLRDVRKYLQEHGLTTPGSSAPENVLRNMYEDARATGDIQNNDASLLLENFKNS